MFVLGLLVWILSQLMTWILPLRFWTGPRSFRLLLHLLHFLHHRELDEDSNRLLVPWKGIGWRSYRDLPKHFTFMALSGLVYYLRFYFLRIVFLFDCVTVCVIDVVVVRVNISESILLNNQSKTIANLQQEISRLKQPYSNS